MRPEGHVRELPRRSGGSLQPNPVELQSSLAPYGVQLRQLHLAEQLAPVEELRRRKPVRRQLRVGGGGVEDDRISTVTDEGDDGATLLDMQYGVF
jgi:hypothetical protein